MGKYDFSDIENKIELNEIQLVKEGDLYKEKRNSIPVLLTLLGIFFVYTPKILVVYIHNMHTTSLCYNIILSIYLFLLFQLIRLLIQFMFPKGMPVNKTPSYFYKDIYNQFKADGYEEVDSYDGVKITYLEYLEKCVANFRVLNRKIGLLYLRIYKMIGYAFILYIILVIHYMLNNPN